jgi:hypothetical protein
MRESPLHYGKKEKLFSPAPRGNAHCAPIFRTPFATDRVKSGQLQLGVQLACALRNNLQPLTADSDF